MTLKAKAKNTTHTNISPRRKTRIIALRQAGTAGELGIALAASMDRLSM
jgi:hypothetical protein